MNTVTTITPTERNRFKHIKEHYLNQIEQDWVINVALSILAARHKPGVSLTSPEETMSYLRLHLAQEVREIFALFFLDTQHRVIRFEKMFFGTIDGASIYPRVIVQRALELNAAALIGTHNHPSGVPEPSQSDRLITDKIKKAATLFDIQFLDHIVVSTHGAYSFAEHGLL